MHTVQYPDKGGRHGLGWQIWRVGDDGVNRLEGHVGEIPGGASFMYCHAYENISVIFFVN